MPVSFNKRNKEKARQERQADKRLRRDERRVKRNQPAAPEEAAQAEGDASVTDELSGPRAAGMPGGETAAEASLASDAAAATAR